MRPTGCPTRSTKHHVIVHSSIALEIGAERDCLDGGRSCFGSKFLSESRLSAQPGQSTVHTEFIGSCSCRRISLSSRLLWSKDHHADHHPGGQDVGVDRSDRPRRCDRRAQTTKVIINRNTECSVCKCGARSGTRWKGRQRGHRSDR